MKEKLYHETINLINEYNDIRKKILEFQFVKEEAEKKLKEIEENIKYEIAFDKNLKNETQRKAKLHELLKENEEYEKISEKLKEVEKKIKNLVVDAETMNLKIKLNTYFIKSEEIKI